jgi:hypothetical protein
VGHDHHLLLVVIARKVWGAKITHDTFDMPVALVTCGRGSAYDDHPLPAN